MCVTVSVAMLFWKGIISDPAIDEGSAGGGIKTPTEALIVLDLFNDRMDTRTHSYELVGAYPIDVGNIAFTNANPGIATLPVTLKFQYWRTKETATQF